MTRLPHGLAWAVALTCTLFVPGEVEAQSQVTPRGEGAVTVSHQWLTSSEHVNRFGVRSAELGRETLHVMVGDAEFGVSDRLSVGGSLVWLTTKWIGEEHDRHGPLDTGAYHSSFQDARVVLRYQLKEGGVSVAPFVTFGGPVTGYETRGHSAFGRHIPELTLGASAGGRIFGRAYWQSGASYAFTNDVDDVDLNLDHVNGDIEFGVSLSPRVTVRAFAVGQWMWEGLEVGPLTDHLELRENHDRFVRSSYANLGVGASFVLSRRVDLGVTAFQTTAARNFHAVRAIVTSLTWKFGGGFKIIPAQSSR